jgi:hypothetical protein
MATNFVYFRNSIKKMADTHTSAINIFSDVNVLFIWNTKNSKLFPVGSGEGKWRQLQLNMDRAGQNYNTNITIKSFRYTATFWFTRTRPTERNKNHILQEVTSRLNLGKRLLELISKYWSSYLGERGSVVYWGTMLQTEISWVRFPIR